MRFFRLLFIKYFFTHDERWMINQSLYIYGCRLANGTKSDYFIECEFICASMASEFAVEIKHDDPLYERI